MIKGCEHGPEHLTGVPCPKCVEESKNEHESLTEKVLPSIKELEDILEKEGSGSIVMLPNGEIRAVE